MKSKYENDDIFFYFNIKYKLLNRYFKKIEIIAFIMNNEKYKLLDHNIQFKQMRRKKEKKRMMRRKGDLNVCLFYHVNNNIIVIK